MNKVPPYFLVSAAPHMALARYPGGKGLHAKHIIDVLPTGERYLEVYCGMANVFSRVEKFPVMVLNDINKHVMNVFRVLQNPETYDMLLHRMIYTPYSQDEFRLALDTLNDPEANNLDCAWAFLVAQNQGFSGIAKTYGHWGRRPYQKNEHLPSLWQRKISNLEVWHKKLMGVYLDNKDAIEFIDFWDKDDKQSVLYLDPPYLEDTRVSKNLYLHETNADHHIRLVEKLCNIHGKGVLSCYDSEIYYPLLDHGWTKQTFKTTAGMAARAENKERTETLYVKES